ncbi:MAG TPA: ATP-binding protein [Rhizomicrobium sp.]|jgi:signal transduction histidine kinase
MSFRRRLMLFLVLVLVAVQGATAVMAYTYLRDSLIDKGKRDLQAASGLFTRQLDLVSERVADGVKVLSLDFALRQAIAQEDRGTELSALRNHGHRIGATRVMLVRLDGTLSVDTGTPAHAGKFPFANLLGDALEGDQGAALATLDGQVYWIVVVPVRAPLPIAFVAAFIPINGALLDQFRTLSTTSRSLALAVRKADGRWVLVAKSANHPVAMPLGDVQPQLVQIGRADWLTVATPLQTAPHSMPVAVVMGYPLEAALGEYSSLIWPMLLIFATALTFSVGGSLAIARGMAQPLEALAAGARRIAAGDYNDPVRITTDPELAQLSGALANMTQSIAEREAALTAAITSVEAARAEAVRANEAKSQFLANMSHELRTPLNAIVGFSEMLGGEVLGPIGTPRYLEYAHDISNSGQHLLSLVAKMLDLAEAEAGRLTLICEPLPLGPIVQRAVARFFPLARSGGVTLTGPETTVHWPLIASDAAKLELAIGGIIHNAIKFTPAGGQVTITGVRRDRRFSLLVVDTGVGMDERVIATVTRPFQRLRSALDGEQQGAGLGLSFAKAIVAAHDGELRIDSKLAVGTSVEMNFPVYVAATSNAA